MTEHPASGGVPEPDGGDADLSENERAELERLRAETAELRRAAPAGPAGPAPPAGPGGRHAGRWRAALSAVLIVVACVLAPLAVVGVWAGRQVSDTDRWVATVGPLIHDPAIQNVLTDRITQEITDQLDLTANIDRAAAQLNASGLSRIGSLLETFSPQISSAVEGFIRGTVHSVITSQAMARAWVQVNRVAHAALVKVLSGQGNGALSTENGQVVLTLGPFINVAKQALVDRGFTLAGSIPQVNPTVTLFEAKYLQQAQAGYRLLTTLKIVLPILALLFFAAGILAARTRRVALTGSGLGLSASMLVLGIGLVIFRISYLNSVPSDVLPPDAAAAVFDAFVSFLKLSLRTLLAAGLVVAVGAYFTGPGRAAVAARSAVKSGLGAIRGFGERKGMSTGPAGRWTYAHRKALRIAAVVIAALVFVFWGQPTVVVVIVIAAILLAVLGLIELTGRPPREHGPADQP